MQEKRSRDGRGTTHIVIALTIVALGVAFYAWVWPSLWVERIFDEESRQRLADPATRAVEARRLGEHRIERAVPYIEPILTVDDEKDRLAAAWSLARIGTRSAARALKPLAGEPNDQLRRYVAVGLARSGADPNEPVVRTLAEDAAKPVRAAMAGVLRTAPMGEAVKELADNLLSDPAVEVRIAAARALAARGGSVGFAGVARAQQDPNTRVRAAADAAVRAEAGRLMPVILQLARGKPGFAERLAALQVLAATGRGSSVVPILQLCSADSGKRDFTTEQTEKLTAATADALAGLGERAIDPIIRETIEGEYPLRAERAAAIACGRIGPAAAGPVAEAITRWRVFPDPRELVFWVDALGETRSREALPALDLALAQAIKGMDAHVAVARAKIADADDGPLPRPNPPKDLLAGEPGKEAYGSFYPGGVLVTPLKGNLSSLPRDGVVRLSLPNAIYQNRGLGTKGRFEVAMDLVRRNGEWERDFLATSMSFNKRVHDGRITDVSNDGRTVKMEIVFNNDLWRRSAFGEYTVTLTEGEGGLAASYEGHCNYDRASGKVAVIAYERDWSQRPSREVDAGMHPRLFCRPEDLPRLRQRARTSPGRGILRAIRRRLAGRKMLYKTPLDWVTNWQPGIEAAMGHGLLATLYDDQRQGRRAAELIMPRIKTPPYHGEHGERQPEPLSMFPWAYDLAHRWLTEDEFRHIRDERAWVKIEFSTRVGPGGVFAAHRAVLALPALGSLSLLEEQATYFTIDRYRQPPGVMDFPPLTEFTPGEGVPVNRIEAGKPINDWLVAGPMPQGSPKETPGQHPLAKLGGPGEADIEKGTSLRYAGKTFRFGKLGVEPSRNIAGVDAGRHVLYLPTQPEGRRYLLYSALRAQRQVTFQLPPRRQFGDMRSAVYIDGRRVRLGTVVVLGKGTHEILVDAVGPLVSVEYPGVDAGFARANVEKFKRLRAMRLAAKKRYDQTGKFQSLPYILRRCDAAVRAQMLHQMKRVAGGKEYRSARWVWPYVAARWVAQGQGMYPDTPLATLTADVPVSKLPNRELVMSLAYAPPEHRAEIKAEFDRRFLPDGLGKLGMLELIAAFVHYPVGE